MARTKVKSGQDPVFDETFDLDDVPPDVMTFTVTVMNRGSRKKDTEVAETTVDINSLKSGSSEQDAQWYPLRGVTPIGEWGSIRLGIRYLHDLIMPAEEYSPLKELILDSQLEVVRALADLCHSDRLQLATALLRIFRFEKKEAELLSTLNRLEIEREDETSVLFRGASLSTALMDVYMKSVCTEFLHSAIFPTVHKILESRNQSCELNPNKIESSTEACANAEYLLQVLDDITESIFMSSEACPRTLRYVCYCLQRNVMQKWPNERFVKTRAVSGFIFLRLLCPAILNPRSFNLISGMWELNTECPKNLRNDFLLEPPPPAASRSLVMIAKCLQNLANLVEFGAKESYMEVVNPFILKNKERMVVFLDHLSVRIIEFQVYYYFNTC